MKPREDSDRIPYSVWAKQGYIEPTPGKATNKRVVALRLAELCARFHPKAIAFDPWGFPELQRNLNEEGFTLALTAFGQGYKSMSSATKAFEERVLNRTLRHSGNPLLTWSISNVCIERDAAQNVKPSKERSWADFTKVGDIIFESGGLLDRIADKFPERIIQRLPNGRPEERLLDKEELAAMLKISKSFVDKHAKEFPFTVRVAESVRFSYLGVLRWIDQQRLHGLKRTAAGNESLRATPEVSPGADLVDGNLFPREKLPRVHRHSERRGSSGG